ncbi:AraC-like ligand binding domain-containing protein [Paenibacillus catalpae]|uniref:AraC-like ligand binding domain-containing protein n=1 Tax=Paenibacillus catalpae TaxID=1045775 RepID=A0A1I1VG51_9BACL|nr:AraC family transcriptional regulator [Paenibacillus catalpae]SFD82042.1 AraC-like ligand binding domain-containing protein [Paenibacillus catalpae]
MQLSNELIYGDAEDLFFLEYNKRKGHFTMSVEHIHGQYELYYLFSGERQYFIKDRTYPIQAGDLVLIPGNELHKTSDTGVPNHARIVLYYNEKYFERYAKEEAALLLSPFLGSRRVLRLAHQERLRFEQLLYGLLQEVQERPPGHEMPIRHAVAEALLFAARHAINMKPESNDSSAPPSPAAAKAMEIASYIAGHFREPLTLDSLSRQFHLSSSYLSRTFKKYTGFGLTEYIGITRVKEAQQQLKETDERITEIAAEVGFESLSQFERVFKTHVRLSPRDYRSQYGQKG